MKIYVEGGSKGDLASKCRKGFREFFEHAGISDSMPRVVAAGGRQQAYDMFCTASRMGEEAMLLVDSETAVESACEPEEDRSTWKPWLHLSKRAGDEWQRPPGAEDMHCHLMVECMENWFLADKDALARYYGQHFRKNALPANTQIEKVPKRDVLRGLASATRDCPKGGYSKGGHSFDILASLNPELVRIASPWAARLLDALT